MDIEQWRLAWTGGLAVGTIVMLILLALALIDVYAVSMSRYSGLDVFKLLTKSDVWDQLILTLAVAGFFLAGALSYVTPGPLVIAVIVVAAYLLVLLGVVKLFRRRRIFRAERFTRDTEAL